MVLNYAARHIPTNLRDLPGTIRSTANHVFFFLLSALILITLMSNIEGEL